MEPEQLGVQAVENVDATVPAQDSLPLVAGHEEVDAPIRRHEKFARRIERLHAMTRERKQIGRAHV